MQKVKPSFLCHEGVGVFVVGRVVEFAATIEFFGEENECTS
jgi:hypothetical protein